MTAFTEAVPFRQIGNRRYLGDDQLKQDRELEAFVRRFRQCFERDHNRCIWIFNEPESRDA